MAKIAVIGSGISGLTCAYLLRNRHEVTLFEANDRLGGHTHTHQITVDNTPVTVDTGFIVYNDRTYPNFMRLLAELGCDGRPTEMSFSLREVERDFEYNGHNLNTLFAQRSNLFRPGFWLMIRDILRFNKMAKTPDLYREKTEQTLDEFLLAHGFSDTFKTRYLYPMAAAIWSTGDQSVGQFPIQSLLDFFINHGLVDLKNRPQWFVVNGGSSQYISAMRPHLNEVRLSTPVRQVKRHEDTVEITTDDDRTEFDQVVFACHSDQALAMLSDASQQENEVLSHMTYTDNVAYLHTDQSRLPRRTKAWASWNYLVSYSKSKVRKSKVSKSEAQTHPDKAHLTYNMNILQHIPTKTQVLVTLNDSNVNPDKILGTFHYSHPFYNQAMLNAQQRHSEISDMRRTHYCGAYWFYGFHEDGVKSALRVCKALGVDW